MSFDFFTIMLSICFATLLFLYQNPDIIKYDHIKWHKGNPKYHKPSFDTNYCAKVSNIIKKEQNNKIHMQKFKWYCNVPMSL